MDWRESFIREYGEKAGTIILSYRGKLGNFGKQIDRLKKEVAAWQSEAQMWKERACMAEAALWCIKEGGEVHLTGDLS